jgi:hypothetical protein
MFSSSQKGVAMGPYLDIWKLPRHSKRAAAGEAKEMTKSAAPASVAEPPKICLCIDFPPSARPAPHTYHSNGRDVTPALNDKGRR